MLLAAPRGARAAGTCDADEQAAFALARGDFSSRADGLGKAPRSLLLCADAAGERARAQAAARRLPALPESTRADVPAPVWARYPDVDARNVSLVRATVTARPAGASVRGDQGDFVPSPGGAGRASPLAPAGPAPVEAALPPGDYWISAAAPGHEGEVAVLRVHGTVPVTATIDLLPRARPAVVAPPRPAVPAPGPLSPVAPPPPPQRERKPAWRRSYWVYAAGAAVAALGIGLVIASETANDTQTIRVGWP